MSQRTSPVWITAAFLGGSLSSLQSRANGELSQTWSSPISAAIWSFGSGFVLISLALLHPAGRAGLGRVAKALRERGLRWWQLLGGVLGGFFVAVQTYAVPQIGVALFTVALVGGQTTNALVVDRLGLGPAGRSPLTPTRVAAAVLTFIGVALAASARGGHADLAWLPLLLAVIAGAGVAVQSAYNGRVNAVSRNPFATSWLNFAWGTSFLLGIALAQLASGRLHLPTASDAPAWAFVGGVFGVIFIAVNSVVVAHLGVLVSMLTFLAGQLVSAVLLDLAFPAPGAHVSGQLVLGVGVTLVAAAWAALGSGRLRPTPAGG